MTCPEGESNWNLGSWQAQGFPQFQEIKLGDWQEIIHSQETAHCSECFWINNVWGSLCDRLRAHLKTKLQNIMCSAVSLKNIKPISWTACWCIWIQNFQAVCCNMTNFGKQLINSQLMWLIVWKNNESPGSVNDYTEMLSSILIKITPLFLLSKEFLMRKWKEHYCNGCDTSRDVSCQRAPAWVLIITRTITSLSCSVSFFRKAKWCKCQNFVNTLTHQTQSQQSRSQHLWAGVKVSI